MKHIFKLIIAVAGIIFFQKLDAQDVDSLSQIVIDQDYQTGEFTDLRDKNVYKWVQIGDQIWMAENLRYFNRLGKTGSKYEYWISGFNGTDRQKARESDNYLKYGVLYNYESAKKRCPDGWHLPSRREWLILIQNVNNKANFIKEKSFWNDAQNDENTNIVGLSIRPAGRYQCSRFRDQNYQALFWSADVRATHKTIKGGYISEIYTFSLKLGSDAIHQTRYLEKYAASVRCVKDSE